MVKRILVGMVLIGVLGAGTAVSAQPPSPRERELEDLVRRLADKVDSLEARLGQVEGKGAAVDTAARVEKLEQSVEEIKKTTPPDQNSEEWSKIKKWVNDSATLRPHWKDGLNFTSNDGDVKLKIGGRIQHDYGYFAEDGAVERRIGDDFDDGTEFRRARLYFSGNIYEDIDFKVQYDFAGGDADFKDVYLGMKNVPCVGSVRVGQFKEPFGLEELTSSNYITFMERSLVSAFTPSRNTGVMVGDTLMDKRMTWAAGFFRQTDDFGNGVGGRDYNATARVTALPIYEDKGKELLHLGLAYTHQNYEDNSIRFRERPEAHLAPRIVDTGTFGAESGDFVGAEVAYVNGPFSVQGEYVHSFIDGRGPWVDDPTFSAASIQASYFLTGEHRPYKTSSGTFDRVKPLENFSRAGGKGAWELAARYSYLDLNDGGVHGGRLTDFTLGVNWYLNPNVRTMWNYVLADPSKGGDISAFMWRFQVAF
jgi:phosphate-selective porin OprO/OprP